MSGSKSGKKTRKISQDSIPFHVKLIHEFVSKSRIRKENLDKVLDKRPLAIEPFKKEKQKRKQIRKLRECGKNPIPVNLEDLTYEKMLEINEIWSEFACDAIKPNDFQSNNIYTVYQKLLKLEVFGMIVTISKSKCENYLNKKGIIVYESERIFKLIDQQNKIFTIPKNGSVFSFELHQHRINLIGNYMTGKSSKRSSRKLKPPAKFVLI